MNGLLIIIHTVHLYQTLANNKNRMAGGLYIVEAVLDLLADDSDEEDLKDLFFPGTDDELGLGEQLCEANDTDEKCDADGTEDELGQGGLAMYLMPMLLLAKLNLLCISIPTMTVMHQ